MSATSRLNRPAKALAALAIGALLQGCSCSEQGFHALDWQVLQNDHGRWLSMDVGPDGRPAVAYYDGTQGALGFAMGEIRGDEIRWRYEKVDGYPDSQGLNPGDVGQFASMRVAPNGTVWIAYQGGAALRVAHRVNGQWSWEIADAGSGLQPRAGRWASLALDADGQPVVAHHDEGAGTLRVVRRVDGDWQGTTVFTGEDFHGFGEDGSEITRSASVGKFARLHIDGNTEYLAFHDAAHRNLHLLQGFPGAYSHTVVHSVEGGNVGHWPSIHTDGSKVAIAFHDAGNQDLMLATREGTGAFAVEVVDNAEWVGADTEIFERDGELAILYFDGRRNAMKLAEREGSGWALWQVAGDEAALGFHNEVIYANGRTWVGSYDFTNRVIFTKPL